MTTDTQTAPWTCAHCGRLNAPSRTTCKKCGVGQGAIPAPTYAAPVPQAAPGTLTMEQRSAILDKAIQKYAGQGYRVTSRTPNTAQLVKPKSFSFLWAFLWLLLFGVGLLVYLFYYLAKRDQTVYLDVDERGKLYKR